VKLHLETTHIHDAPTLTVSPARAEGRPAVFYICGYGHTREAGLRLGYQLAQRGLFFISFDPWLHGERYDRRLDHAADTELGASIRRPRDSTPASSSTASSRSACSMCRC
jgi:hypothetical protein